MKPLTAVDLIRHFDALPNDAIVPLKVSRIIRNTSEWTDRRDPKLPRIQSPRSGTVTASVIFAPWFAANNRLPENTSTRAGLHGPGRIEVADWTLAPPT
jgi:hypothetical protein